MANLPTRIKWNRSEDGFTSSKCGRFTITPMFRGCERPTGFKVQDNATGRCLGERETQRDAKETAEMQLDYEAL